VTKCEIFYCSDFHEFYTIKSLWEGGFGVKIAIENLTLGHLGINVQGSFVHFTSNTAGNTFLSGLYAAVEKNAHRKKRARIFRTEAVF
jgi:hypothetical protein